MLLSEDMGREIIVKMTGVIVQSVQGQYSPTNLKNILCLFLQDLIL